MKTKIFALLSLFLLIKGSMNSYSQVTIGLGESPEKYATLQVKDKAREVSASLDGATADKGGILLPRVELQKRYQLLPFVAQDIVDANDQDYQDAKLVHTGLIVYNLTENDDEELCLGLNQWDGGKMELLPDKTGKCHCNFGKLRFAYIYGTISKQCSINFSQLHDNAIACKESRSIHDYSSAQS